MPSQSSDRWVLVPGTLCTPEVFAPMLDQFGVTPDRVEIIETSAPHVHDYETPLRDAVMGGKLSVVSALAR